MADGAAVLAGIARAARGDLRGADAEPEGLRGRPRGGGGRRWRSSPRPRRASAGATSTARSPRAWRASRRWPRRRARDGVPLRGYVSCVTDCPFEGAIDAADGRRVAARLLALGCREVSLGDTIGHGTPESVARMLQAVLDVAPPERLAGHFHDTRGPGARQYRRWRSTTGCGCSTPPAAGSAAAPSRRAPREMSRPNGWLRGSRRSGSTPGSTPARLAAAAGFARGPAVARHERFGRRSTGRRVRPSRSCDKDNLFLHRKLSYGGSPDEQERRGRKLDAGSHHRRARDRRPDQRAADRARHGPDARARAWRTCCTRRPASG